MIRFTERGSNSNACQYWSIFCYVALALSGWHMSKNFLLMHLGNVNLLTAISVNKKPVLNQLAHVTVVYNWYGFTKSVFTHSHVNTHVLLVMSFEPV